jgi:hypothetical protein
MIGCSGGITRNPRPWCCRSETVVGHGLNGQPTSLATGRHHWPICEFHVLLNPFWPFSTLKVLALKTTVLLLLTLLIKAKIRITAFSALGFFLLVLQTLVFLAISGGLVLAAGGAALYSTQKQRPTVS